MVLDRRAFAFTTQRFRDLQLLSTDERRHVLGLLDDDFAFPDALAACDTVHVHVKVDDVDALPHHKISDLGGAGSRRMRPPDM